MLDWHENMTKDEVPPSWMWPLDWELELWFENVENRRKEKYGSGSSDREDETVPMMANELSRGRR